MYVPRHFRPEREDELWAVVERYFFGEVVSAVDGEPPRATLAPFVLREEDGRRRLWGHMARANPQWRDFRGDREVLAVFRGPHHYISPRWYANEPNVPTWNFVVVHAYGRPRLLERDDPRVIWILERTVEQAEARLGQTFEPDPDYVRTLAPGVAAFELEAARVEGSFKLNQNHPAANRLGVIAGLETLGGDEACEIARLMREREA